ncbi:DUF6597 domain-containing transcriptional factor [Marinobacter sp. GN3S48]|uniref:DUF6597 domain-containing transcriptional factor n=1 Tax=Marinobacter sp. GN3S48 TaxID=3382302 RepID=UPI00387B3EB1
MHALSKFHYREWPPPPALTRQLVCLWQLHITGNTDGQRPILPDGCVDLIWLNGATPLVAGPMDRAQHFTLPPGTAVLGARLRPGWAGVALGLPAAQFRNLHVPLADILRTSPLCTATQLTLTKLPALLQKYFVDIAPLDPTMCYTAHWLASNPDGQIRQLAKELQLSERLLHRRCQVALGYGPKVFQRIMRLQRVRWLANTSLSTSLTWLAMESGYADQAHLCREVRTLTGQSPTRLLPRHLSGVALSDLFNSPLSS